MQKITDLNVVQLVALYNQVKNELAQLAQLVPFKGQDAASMEELVEAFYGREAMELGEARVCFGSK